MKTKEEFTEEECEHIEEIANALADANIKYLESNCEDDFAGKEIQKLRKELEEMGFELQFTNSFDFRANKYTCVIALWLPKNIH